MRLDPARPLIASLRLGPRGAGGAAVRTPADALAALTRRTAPPPRAMTSLPATAAITPATQILERVLPWMLASWPSSQLESEFCSIWESGGFCEVARLERG